MKLNICNVVCVWDLMLKLDGLGKHNYICQSCDFAVKWEPKWRFWLCRILHLVCDVIMWWWSTTSASDVFIPLNFTYGRILASYSVSWWASSFRWDILRKTYIKFSLWFIFIKIIQTEVPKILFSIKIYLYKL